ncbi:MAG: 50S ribosomal protein L15 [Fidelibacterota bacterium]
MRLNDIRPKKGSRRPKKRIGRGMGSGTGKTAGRGEKGQKSRSGFSRARGFEGGQMPLHRRLPKRGFTNIHRREYAAINVGRLAELPPGSTVNPEFLKKQGFVPQKTEWVKVLGAGEISVSLVISAHRFSSGATAKIEGAGGKVQVIPMAPRGPVARDSSRVGGDSR